MGVQINDLKLLLEARAHGASFEKVLTLGRLSVNIQRHDFEDLLVRHGLKAAGRPTFFEQYGTGLNADDLFRLLGAKVTDSMDNSGFEGASILHDLNKPLPDYCVDQYDVVIDGGTLEHVFNLPQALHNAMRAVRPGGRLFLFQMGNNCCGHGFYCFSPELFYRTLSPTHGFEVERLLAYESDDLENVHSVPDTSASLRRVEIRSLHAVMLMVQAKKIGDCAHLFELPPQQSDYAQKWQDSPANPAGPSSSPIPQPTSKKPRKHSFLHDMPWYARWQTLRQTRRRARREDRQFSLNNTRLFPRYLFDI